VRLSRSDLEGALSFVSEAGSEDEPCEPHLLERLATLIRCDAISYAELEPGRAEVVFETTFGCDPEEPEEPYWATVHEHPIHLHRDATGTRAAVKIYDFITPRELRRTRFYSEFIRPWASPFMMDISLPAPSGRTRGFCFIRNETDFGERERSLLEALRPHLTHLRQVADERARTRQPYHENITKRQGEVLTLVGEGLTNRQIAERLWISPGTVRRHLDNIYSALDVHTRSAALRATTRPALDKAH